MQFELKNKDLTVLTQVIDKLHITNMKVNRGKAKVFTHANQKLQEFAQDERDILTAFAALDDKGNFTYGDDDQLVLKDDVTIAEVNQQLNELQEEVVTISSGDYTNRYIDFFSWLADSEEELSTDEVILIDNLLEQYEKQEGETE